MGLSEFASSATILERHFSAADWLVGSDVTYADFRVACVLPFADLAGLPLADFPRAEAWHARLMDIPTWHDPFEGLEAPELPPNQDDPSVKRRRGDPKGGGGPVADWRVFGDPLEDHDLRRGAEKRPRRRAPCLFDGPINGERFRAYVEQELVPTLKQRAFASQLVRPFLPRRLWLPPSPR
jgi:hypothetical protein